MGVESFGSRKKQGEEERRGDLIECISEVRPALLLLFGINPVLVAVSRLRLIP